MDLRLIQFVLSIAEEKNITKAAEKLFVTQSALNQALLKLEHELDVPLFYRSHNEMIPTEAGKIYIDYGHKILACKKEAYAKINDISKCFAGNVSIGLTRERSGPLIIDCFKKFKTEYPNIHLDVIETNVKNIFDLLAKQKIDFGIITIGNIIDERFEYVHIWDEEIILAVPSTNPIVKKYQNEKNLPLKLFAGSQFILMTKLSSYRSLIDSLFKSNGFTPNVILETANNTTKLSMVRHGFGCALIPKMYVQKNDNVQYYTLPEHPHIDIAVAYKKGFYINKACKYLIELTKEYWSSYPYTEL